MSHIIAAMPPGASPSRPSLRREIARPIALGFAAVLAFSLTGCGAIGDCFGWRQLPPPGPRPSAVVLDFSQAPRVVERRDTCRNPVVGEKDVETEKDRRGWWFGSQDVYYNKNWGIILADLLDEKLREDCVFDLRSRSDVRYYYADKRDILAQELKLSGDELDKAVLALNPVKIGQEMGVDKVVVGQIVDAELRFNRTVGTYCSVANVNLSVYDTATGNLEYSQNFLNTRALSTTYGVLEEVADAFLSYLKNHYGSRTVPRYSVRQ